MSIAEVEAEWVHCSEAGRSGWQPSLLPHPSPLSTALLTRCFFWWEPSLLLRLTTLSAAVRLSFLESTWSPVQVDATFEPTFVNSANLAGCCGWERTLLPRLQHHPSPCQHFYPLGWCACSLMYLHCSSQSIWECVLEPCMRRLALYINTDVPVSDNCPCQEVWMAGTGWW